MSKLDVEYFAKLARIDLNDTEIESIQKDMNEILKMVDVLQELNLEGVKQETHILDISNVFKDDVIKKTTSLDEVLSTMPEIEDNSLKVAKIVE